MDETKRCTACAMELREEAKRCPHCRTWQEGSEPLHRGVPGRSVGGVCAGLARHFGVDVALLRVGFVLALAFSGGTALLVYGLLWALTPASAVGHAPAQRAVDWLSSLMRPAPESGPEPVVERRV